MTGLALAAAVDRGGRAQHHPPHTGFHTGVQDVQGSLAVDRVQVFLSPLGRGQSGQMEDHPDAPHCLLQILMFSDVTRNYLDGKISDIFPPPRGKIIKDPNFIASSNEMFGEMGADKSCPAYYEVVHAMHPLLGVVLQFRPANPSSGRKGIRLFLIAA